MDAAWILAPTAASSRTSTKAIAALPPMFSRPPPFPLFRKFPTLSKPSATERVRPRLTTDGCPIPNPRRTCRNRYERIQNEIQGLFLTGRWLYGKRRRSVWRMQDRSSHSRPPSLFVYSNPHRLSTSFSDIRLSSIVHFPLLLPLPSSILILL